MKEYSEAMEQAGTPCPFEGKIGKQAKAAWKKYDKLKTRSTINTF